MDQPINQSTNQPINQSINQSIYLFVYALLSLSLSLYVHVFFCAYIWTEGYLSTVGQVDRDLSYESCTSVMLVEGSITAWWIWIRVKVGIQRINLNGLVLISRERLSEGFF